MAKRRKIRIKWGRVITVLVALGLTAFLAVKGMTLLFGYISHFDLSELAGNKSYIATVVIDPGHGGEDKGNAHNELFEKDLNLKVSQEIAKVLDKNNIRAVLTRSEDVALSEAKNEDMALREKASEDNKAMYFVSIHTNAYSGNEALSGYEVYIKDKKSETIANSIITSLKEAGFENSRGIYDGYLLNILRRNSVNSVIVEMGYLNGSDFDYLQDEEKLKTFANGVANGIVNQIETELGLHDDTTNENE